MAIQQAPAADLDAAFPTHYSDAPRLRKLTQLLAQRGVTLVPAIDCSGDLGLRAKFYMGSQLNWIRVHCDELRGFATTTHSGGNAANLWTSVDAGLTYSDIASVVCERLNARN